VKSITRQYLGTLAFLMLAGFGLPVRGAAPCVELTPNNLSFGSQLADTSSSPSAIDLTNTGSASLKIYEHNSRIVLRRHGVEIGNSSLKVLPRN
jgi:hypothetical protein